MDTISRWVLAGWLLLNLVQAGVTELWHDEAYYWVFSQWLDWGFKDHPPVTALLVNAGSALLPGELGVRLFMVFLSTITLWMTWRLVRPARPLLFWAVILAMPVLHIGGFIAAPDVPLMFGTLLFFTIWKEWLERDTWPLTLALAGVLAFLAYTKYHGALLFLFALAPNYRIMSRPRFWAACLLTGVALLPHLYWQYTHDWLTFRYHLKDRAGDAWKFRFVPEYLAGQWAIWGPLTSFWLWWAVFRSRSRNAFDRSLQWTGIGFVTFFFLQSWKQPTEANWTAPVFLSLVALGYRYLEERPRLAQWAIRLSGCTLVLLVVLRLYLAWDFLPPNGRKAPEFHHWDEWAGMVARVAGDVPVVFTNRYQRPSKYLFYSRRPAYCVSTEVDTGTQYDLLYEMEEAVQGKRVCLVHEHPREDHRVDTIVAVTPSGRPVGFRWVDDFRSYNRIWCRLDTTITTLPPNAKVSLPVRIINPTREYVSWDLEGDRAVTFEYLFIADDKVRTEGLALDPAAGRPWPGTTLAPGQSFDTRIEIMTPAEPCEYRLRLAWRVKGLLRGKNSGFYNIGIQAP